MEFLAIASPPLPFVLLFWEEASLVVQCNQSIRHSHKCLLDGKGCGEKQQPILLNKAPIFPDEKDTEKSVDVVKNDL